MMRAARGFTLIEMVAVIALTGIIAVMVSRNLTAPVESFLDLSTRAALVDSAELALQRLSREVRLALPNSVRLTNQALAQGLPNCTASGGSQCAVEILRTSEGGRYRAESDGSDTACTPAGDDRLDFTAANDCFEVMGELAGSVAVDPAADQDDCRQGTVDCLVIFNTGQDGANAYAGDNMAGIQAAATSIITFNTDPALSFPFPSPRQRFHIVDMPVSFVCDSQAGTLTRIANYPITANQLLSPPLGAFGSSALLVGNVESCTFSYQQGTGSRNALLTVTVVLRDTDSQSTDNRVRLVQQISVPNIP